MLSIRPAQACDVAALRTMIHEFAAFERLPVGVTEADLMRDGFGETPRFRAFMAEWDSQPAGYAFFFDYYSTFHGRAGLFLEDIYVRDCIGEKELERPCSPAWRRSRNRRAALACAGKCSTGIPPRSGSTRSSALHFWMSGNP